MRIARRHRVAPSITLPTIADIAMLLLIFFVLCGRMSPAARVSIDPPRSVTAPAQEAPGPIVVTVPPDGTLYLAGRRVEPEQLREELDALLARRLGRQDRTVTIEVDKTTPFRAYVVAVDAVNRAKGYVELKVIR